MVPDNQSPPLRFIPESPVVIHTAPAAILHVVGDVVQVDHLVHHGRHHVLDGPGQRFRPKVQLMPPVVLPPPRLSHGDVSICPWRALDGDDRLLQLPAEPVRIERPEHLFQIPRRPAGLDCLFHVIRSLLWLPTTARRPFRLVAVQLSSGRFSIFCVRVLRSDSIRPCNPGRCQCIGPLNHTDSWRT